MAAALARAEPCRPTQFANAAALVRATAAKAEPQPKGTDGSRTCFELSDYRAGLCLASLLSIFLFLELVLPLRTAVQIGADEGMELGKAMLCLKGHRLYTEIWNDQPPLHTFLVAQVLAHLSPSVLGPRLISVALGGVLLASLFIIVLRTSGLLVATLATGFALASPGFVQLSASCMLEVPAVAMAVAGLCALSLQRDHTRCHGFAAEVACGALFGLALLMKLVPAILLPVAALGLCLRHRNMRRTIASLLFMGTALGVTFVMTDLLIEQGAFLRHFGQSWTSHFGLAKTVEYGSAADHPFDWRILFRNWDETLPAALGIGLFVLRRPLHVQISSGNVLAPAWLALVLLVFGVHRPWWSYYYTYITIPLCWCAALGITAVLHWLRPATASNCPGTVDQPRGLGVRPSSGALEPDSTCKRSGSASQCMRQTEKQPSSSSSFSSWSSKDDDDDHCELNPRFETIRRFGLTVVLGAYILSAGAWMGARVYLQVAEIRNSPQLYYSLVLQKLRSLQSHPEYIYADEPIYSFHSGIPTVPALGVLPLKRFWAGEMTNSRLATELANCLPGAILLKDDNRELPFQELLNVRYRLVYLDRDHRLYVLKDSGRSLTDFQLLTGHSVAK